MEWCLVFTLKKTKDYRYIIEFKKDSYTEASAFAGAIIFEITPVCEKFKTQIGDFNVIEKKELPLFLKQKT